MDKQYDAAATEARWYARWQEMGCFEPDAAAEADPERKQYCITIPPPNVTGSLHMGHALDHTIQDILGRWRRMSGDNVLIQPGVDHGGISTQNVVEKEIVKEGLTRQALGRDAFLDRVNRWKDAYGARIVEQMQRLGCAYDWRRERYTMDPAYSDAVLEHFVRLFDQGLIYRGARVINWCPFHETALSDIEVEYVERDTSLWHIRYPFADGDGGVVVATTRPETLLGDTAVAVNPGDARYAGMQGRTLVVPLTGGREIPLIFDEHVSPEFGTGALKVTPAHSLDDYEIGRRHHLPQIVVIGESGRMTATAGDAYAGLTREEAREAVERDLEAEGLLTGKEPLRHSVGTCERCHTIIEPLLSEQWFVRMAGTAMVERAIAVVKSGEIEFVPDRYARVYLDWMENIRDWCISRQLWWGHRIPIYYATDGTFTAAKSAGEAAAKLGATAGELRQDEDVLDTWFSSDLWPFATLGWPDQTRELAAFYPTDVLTTAREILYLWVARMVMMGLEFTGKIPFKQVYIHATVLDKQGRRMQKSLGNGIDPIEMIDRYGADALRFSLVRLASKGQDIRFSEERIPESRNFCTKIWNAARFVLMNLTAEPANLGATEGEAQPMLTFAEIQAAQPGADALSIPERWILTRLQQTAEVVNRALIAYDMDDACAALYEFFWNDYCDWMVEIAKPALRSENAAARRSMQWTLWHVLESALRLMHPLMPFETEEIWQALPHQGETIMRAPFPKRVAALIDEDAASQMETIIAAIRAIRNARGELKIAPSLTIEAIIAADAATRGLLVANAATLQTLAKIKPPVYADSAPSGEGIVALAVQPGLDISLPLAGAVDMEKEKARLDAELVKVESDIAKLTAKLDNPRFVANAAPDIVARDRALLAELTERREKIVARRAALG